MLAIASLMSRQKRNSLHEFSNEQGKKQTSNKKRGAVGVKIAVFRKGRAGLRFV
jgi:hypothetical protein